MNTNQKAIELLEKNEYEEALELFKKAVEESRDVQSLTNLAWIYSYEEEDDEKALELVKEAVDMNPTSPIPYLLLGELYLKAEKWQEALHTLTQSVAVEPSIAAYNNLGVASYHLGKLEDASQCFLKGAVGSDYSSLSHVQCLMELGKKEEAKEKLDSFSEEDDEFVGEIEVADLYLELDCIEEAIPWYQKGWERYYKQPNWINRYVYALHKVNRGDEAEAIVEEAIADKNREIEDTLKMELDEYWSEVDMEEHVKQLLQERKEYEEIIKRILSGYIPPVDEFKTSLYTGCYLFGCKRHNHPEYNEEK